ncbi:MAG: sulfur carrier protein ThiS [Planctomycetota bacterium]
MSASVSIQFNGQTIDVPDQTSIRGLLELAEMRSKLVAVEVNGAIVPHEEFDAHLILENDVVEAVTVVGGG